jgi:hypothetical protein
VTETTQPDPQVVAWMREYLRKNPDAYAVDVNEAYYLCYPHNDLTSRDFVQALHAAKQPVTVADIPAGQGAVSLYVGRPEAFRRAGLGEFALLFKRADGSSEVVDWPPEGQSPGSAALWDHLAATLPHVTD